MEIRGPIENPSIEVVDQWKIELNVSIAYDDAVIIDSHPWARSVRKKLGGANLAGKFTANSPRLSALRVTPGTQQIILRGVDPTGTAGANLYWRDTYGSF
jgi:hypothetical protein